MGQAHERAICHMRLATITPTRQSTFLSDFTVTRTESVKFTVSLNFHYQKSLVDGLFCQTSTGYGAFSHRKTRIATHNPLSLSHPQGSNFLSSCHSPPYYWCSFSIILQITEKLKHCSVVCLSGLKFSFQLLSM